MKRDWPWWKWVLMIGGVLAAISFLGALFLLISGKQDQWITLVLASAFIAIVVAQLRRDHPNA
jgi:hypothetical protein